MRIILLFILYLGSFCAFAAPFSAINSTENYFEEIKNDPIKLELFLSHMPKGGDLHNHLSGASFAENLIKYGQKDNLCLDQTTFSVSSNPLCSDQNRLENIKEGSTLYDEIIDAWSMHHFKPSQESGHDHFFNSFAKFNAISSKHSGEMLAEVAERAGEQNELYLELMETPDHNASGLLGKKIGWDDDLARLRKKLLDNGLPDIIASMSKAIDQDEAGLKRILFCDTKEAKPGCEVNIRFLYQVLREQPKEQVFAQLVAGFEAASHDKRIVGINMVQPEDGVISMRDYKLHMQMINFLHEVYPKVFITLHAGELVPGLVSDEGLKFHISDAVNTAHATRIGHGVDIRYEDHMENTLQKMANEKIMVEINLSSNKAILGVSGNEHPILTYLKNNVPIALSTDDEGIERTTLTSQYEKAVLTYHFDYFMIKKLVRNSIQYSFLPGESLWLDSDYQHKVPACVNDISVASTPCTQFLNANEKAKEEWELEKKFDVFEKQF